jgi:hypothetical protein
MNKLGFALVAIVALTALVGSSVYADTFCVIRNNLGQVGVTDGTPVYGWSKISNSDCYATADAAERDAGTGKSAPMISGAYTFFHPFPQAVPKGPAQPFMEEGLP